MANELLSDVGTVIGTDVKEIKEAVSGNYTQIGLQNEVNFNAFGLTKREDDDRYLETDTPNLLTDHIGDSVRLSDGLVDRLGDELVTNGDFSNGTAGWSAFNTELSVNDGILHIANNDTSQGRADSTIEITAGKSYLVNLYLFAKYINSALFMYDNASKYKPLSLGQNTFVVTLTSSEIAIQVGGVPNSTSYIDIDNISVKELPQATMPLAPFDPASTDELLDDKVNGVTTQVNHVKGDIVVTGNELVTNGTFDTDATGWDLTNSVWNNSAIDLNISGDTQAALGQSHVYTKGTKMSVTYEITAYTSGEISASFYNGSKYSRGQEASSVGTYTDVFDIILASQATLRFLTAATSGGFIGTIDNISVTAVDSTYQAIQDTTVGDLLTEIPYLIETDYTAGTRVQNNELSYVALVDNLQSTDGVDYPVTDGSRWEEDTRFKTIPDVTRQDVIAISKTGYKTYKGLAYHDELVSTDDIATSLSFSKLGNGLYSDGVDDITIVGLRSTLC